MRKFAAITLLLIAAATAAAAHFREPSSSGAPIAFYFWKTRWSPTPEMLESLQQNRTSRLYMRFFDVAWQAGVPVPIMPIEFAQAVPSQIEVIPVVFFKNEVFQKISESSAPHLARHVWEKIRAMDRSPSLHEIQIDCDWSDTSRQRFFQFADALASLAHEAHIEISATIRLHQVKYAQLTGIPPVDRGMLMFYNVGHLEASSERSSIYNSHDARLYSDWIAHYPLQLDLALPAFSWVVHSRNQLVLGLLEDVGSADLDANSSFRRISDLHYAVDQSIFFRGRYFRAGDLLVLEDLNPQLTQEAATLAGQGLGRSKSYSTVALFDLSERTVRKYGQNELRSILHALN